MSIGSVCIRAYGKNMIFKNIITHFLSERQFIDRKWEKSGLIVTGKAIVSILAVKKGAFSTFSFPIHSMNHDWSFYQSNIQPFLSRKAFPGKSGDFWLDCERKGHCDLSNG